MVFESFWVIKRFSGAVTTVTPMLHTNFLSSRLKPAVEEDRKRAHSFGNWSQPLAKLGSAGRLLKKQHQTTAAPVLSAAESAAMAALGDDFRPRSESNPGMMIKVFFSVSFSLNFVYFQKSNLNFSIEFRKKN